MSPTPRDARRPQGPHRQRDAVAVGGGWADGIGEQLEGDAAQSAHRRQRRRQNVCVRARGGRGGGVALGHAESCSRGSGPSPAAARPSFPSAPRTGSARDRQWAQPAAGSACSAADPGPAGSERRCRRRRAPACTHHLRDFPGHKYHHDDICSTVIK